METKLEKSLNFLARLFAPLGVVWFVLEPTLGILTEVKMDSIPYKWRIALWVFLLLAGVFWAVYNALPVNKISFKIEGNDITISFGNLLTKEKCNKVVAVSQFLYETDVVETSLQKQVIKKMREGAYISRLKEALGDTPFNLSKERKLKYANELLAYEFPLGTTTKISGDDDDPYILFALTKTEHGNVQDNCDVPTLWQALGKFWESAYKEAGNLPIAIPLIGDNVKGIGLPPLKILELNLLAILHASKALNRNKLVDGGQIEIVLFNGSKLVRDGINLKKVASIWKNV